jgi:hypothetical protein
MSSMPARFDWTLVLSLLPGIGPFNFGDFDGDGVDRRSLAAAVTGPGEFLSRRAIGPSGLPFLTVQKSDVSAATIGPSGEFRRRRCRRCPELA